MILSRQIRAARGMLGISQLELHLDTNISINTISKIEKSQKCLERSGMGTVNKIKKALENRGIEFTLPKDENGKIVIGVKLYVDSEEDF